MDQKLAGVPLFFWGGGAGSPCNNVTWAEAYLRTKWHLDPSCSSLATINMGRNVQGAVPRFQGGAGSPSSTMWPRLRPTYIPSGIMIHPAVWPQ